MQMLDGDNNSYPVHTEQADGTTTTQRRQPPRQVHPSVPKIDIDNEIPFSRGKSNTFTQVAKLSKK
jgi:hypothetical protein